MSCDQPRGRGLALDCRCSRQIPSPGVRAISKSGAVISPNVSEGKERVWRPLL